jgi:putative tricarboxylic transport membrane protein
LSDEPRDTAFDMIENLAAGLAMVATVQNVIAIFGGVAIGIIVGALPGMSGTLGVTLALPFTFYLNPVTGILLLLGIYKGAVYGGSISAILIKTPGMASSACTILDGYPLAQRGEADKALKMALYASCVADFISNLA